MIVSFCGNFVTISLNQTDRESVWSFVTSYGLLVEDLWLWNFWLRFEWAHSIDLSIILLEQRAIVIQKINNRRLLEASVSIGKFDIFPICQSPLHIVVATIVCILLLPDHYLICITTTTATTEHRGRHHHVWKNFESTLIYTCHAICVKFSADLYYCYHWFCP